MKIIGHRGARGLAPENSLAAIKAGIAAGADEIEIDVRVTADGVPVLCHDEFIVDPLNGLRYFIKDYDFVSLKHRKPNLATLTEAIKVTSGVIPLLIEIKPKVNPGPIIALLQGHLHASAKPHDFIIASFNQRILREVRAVLPQLELVVNEKWSAVRGEIRARLLHTKRLHMNARWLHGGLIIQLQRAGFQVAPYTVNNPKKIQSCAALLAGVITDYPDRFPH